MNGTSLDLPMIIDRAKRDLSDVELEVVDSIFWDGLTQAQTARHLCVSYERVRQVLSRSLRKMRHSTRAGVFFEWALDYFKEMEGNYE